MNRLTFRLCCFALLLVVPAFAASEPQAPWHVTVLGDSLTAGYGLPIEEAFPAQLERTLRSRGLAVEVSNAGVSGDTSAGGLARLDWALADRPDLVIIELGANDALRALPPESTAANLDAILARLQRQKIAALLTGMVAPRNLGREYYSDFDALYPRLAAKYHVPFYPFFLAGVAGDPALNQADDLHPNVRGVAEIVRRMVPLVAKTLAELPPRTGGH